MAAVLALACVAHSTLVEARVMRVAEAQCRLWLIHRLGGAILMKPDDNAFELTRFSAGDTVS